jgi:hypothetical protein
MVMLYQISLWGDLFWVFEPRLFLGGMGHLGQLVFVGEFSEVALRGGGCDHLPTPSTSRASLGVRIELFG